MISSICQLTLQMALITGTWVRPKPEPGAFSRCPCVQRGPISWVILGCLSPVIIKELDQKCSHRDMNQHTVDAAVPAGSFTCYARKPTLFIGILNLSHHLLPPKLVLVKSKINKMEDNDISFSLHWIVFLETSFHFSATQI